MYTDILYLAGTLVFFGAMLAYVRALRPAGPARRPGALDMGARFPDRGRCIALAILVYLMYTLLTRSGSDMTANGWLQIAFFVLAVLLVTKPLGCTSWRSTRGGCAGSRPSSGAVPRRPASTPRRTSTGRATPAAMLLFSAASMLLTYVALRLQHLLPLNPQGFAAVPDRQAFETAASFTTNTNWQSYAGESTMSYFSQMTQLAFHNFVVRRGRAWRSPSRWCAASRGARPARLGNFWVDLVRGTLYVLLPLSLVVALFMVQQGVIQNFEPYLEVTTLEGAKQTIAMGPVASQEAIKQLGTNGGGFFNANAAHPFENPTPWTNFWSMFAIFAIPSALT